MYVVKTIGSVGALPFPAAPPPAPDGESLGPVVVGAALAGVLAGALGLWALNHYAPRRSRRRR